MELNGFARKRNVQVNQFMKTESDSDFGSIISHCSHRTVPNYFRTCSEEGRLVHSYFPIFLLSRGIQVNLPSNKDDQTDRCGLLRD